VLARPAFIDSWSSPFAWFVMSCVHFAEVITRESVEALAVYLERRRQQLGGGAIIEVGAGNGRLAYHLNQILSEPLLASDVLPAPVPSLPPGTFPVEALDAHAAVVKYKPVIVVCAWMAIGEDWTVQWRQEGVAEYVLIGEQATLTLPNVPHALPASTPLLDRPPGKSKLGLCPSYPLISDHPGYQRALLEDVSRHMIHVGDTQLSGRAAFEEPGRACAVAYTRKDLAAAQHRG